MKKILKYLNEIPDSKLVRLASSIDKSKSQLKQDLFVLAELDFKKNDSIRKYVGLSKWDDWYVKSE